MKKTLLLLSTIALISACADLSQYSAVDSNASSQAKMKACLIGEANTRFQAGTLFNASVTTTANDLVNTCLKKLALQAAGISTEAQSTAQNIISNLQNFGQAN